MFAEGGGIKLLPKLTEHTTEVCCTVLELVMESTCFSVSNEHLLLFLHC
jgi:hypothetical protein